MSCYRNHLEYPTNSRGISHEPFNAHGLSGRHSSHGWRHSGCGCSPSKRDRQPHGSSAGHAVEDLGLPERSDEDRDSFLRKNGFSKTDTAKIIQSVIAEEGHPPASLFDFVQGITAHARAKSNQDTRLEIEGKARKLFAKAN